MQDGEGTFTVGDDIFEAKGGRIVVAPAGVLHKPVNYGAGRDRHVNIHDSERVTQTECLDGFRKLGDGNGGIGS